MKVVGSRSVSGKAGSQSEPATVSPVHRLQRRDLLVERRVGMEPEEIAEGILETAIERRPVLAALAEGVVEEFREKSSSPSEFEELPEWTPEAEIET